MQYQTRMMMGGGSITPAIKGLIIINVAVFILQYLTGYTFWKNFGLITNEVWRDFSIWQLFTYQFLHGGIFHLLFNMLALWMFGCDLERRWGNQFFLKYYFICVVGGAILNAVFLSDQRVLVIGASAGVYGVLLAYGLLYPKRTIYLYFLFPIQMKYFLIIIGAVTFYSSIAATHSGISHLAHLGGMGFGYIFLRWGNPWVRVRIYIDQYRLAQRKRRFHIIDGNKDDDDEDSKPTLH
ncbi:MAG: rhomboid family intramembrane serine protease [Candidatus Binatia bacterium]